MRRFDNAPFTVWAVILGALVSCGRSEKIGWADREPPAKETAGRAATGAAEGGATVQIREYQRLAASVESLRVAAMKDETIAAQWDTLRAAVDDRVAEKGKLERKLVERQREIEARLAEAEESGEQLSEEERATLAEHYQNIQTRLGEERSAVFAEREFAERLGAFQVALYDKMRTLAPLRAAQIDSLEVLGLQLYQALDSVRHSSGN